MKSISDSRPALEIAAARAHAMTSRYQSRVEESRAIIRDGLIISPDAYVSCSFGKDSAVLLHLVLSLNPSVCVRFVRWTESEVLDNYAEVIAAWQAQVPSLDLLILDLHRDSFAPDTANRYVDLARLRPASGYFIGLRIDESRTRRMSLRKLGAIHRNASQGGLWRIAPLMWWSDLDIASYCVEHDLPMLNTYHREGFSARTSSRVPRAQVRQKALNELRMRDPDAFERLADILPDVREWLQ